MWRGDLLLFNPYHDKLGRFATKTGGSRVDLKGFHGEVDNIGRRLGRSVSGIDHRGIDYDVSDVVKEYGFAAFYDPDSKLMVLSEEAAGHLARGNTQARQLLIHELLHTRGGPGRLRSRTTNAHNREEGQVSLFTAREYKRMYGRFEPNWNWRSDFYRDQIRANAGYFMKQSKGDPKRAWKLLDDAHRQGVKYRGSYQAMLEQASDEAVDQMLEAA